MTNVWSDVFDSNSFFLTFQNKEGYLFFLLLQFRVRKKEPFNEEIKEMSVDFYGWSTLSLGQNVSNAQSLL